MSRRVRKSLTDLKDGHLWSEVTRTVKPLRPTPKVYVHAEPGKKPVGKPASKSGPAPIAMPSYIPQGPRDSSQHQSIEPSLKKRLIRGRLPIDATLDLHGLTQNQAHQALERFINARVARGDRTVLIITGKGIKSNRAGTIEQRGVLRTMLPVWLSAPHMAGLVAGLEPAARGHGGDGAYYVRLKRGRK